MRRRKLEELLADECEAAEDTQDWDIPMVRNRPTNPGDSLSQPVIRDTKPWKHRITTRLWDWVDTTIAWLYYHRRR